MTAKRKVRPFEWWKSKPSGSPNPEIEAFLDSLENDRRFFILNEFAGRSEIQQNAHIRIMEKERHE